MLRVVTNPNPDGGVTYLFDDVTERIDLESRINALLRPAGRDARQPRRGASRCSAPTAGSSCTIPSFVRLWRLSPRRAGRASPHIEVIGAGARRCARDDAWAALRATVTAIGGRHEPVARRIERADGSVLDCAGRRCPTASTLVTFRDVTDSVTVERALTERNEALEQADGLKTRFVHHVSYELRSPLTNIIGFAQLLGDPAIGPLNAKQRDYVGHITGSSARAARHHRRHPRSRHHRHRRDEHRARPRSTSARPCAPPSTACRTASPRPASSWCSTWRRAIGTFVADAKRVRQVLFNLLSNAVGFSPPRRHHHAGRPRARAARWCSASPTRAAAFPPS